MHMFGKSKLGKSKIGTFHVAGVTFAFRDLCGGHCDGWRQTGPTGKTIAHGFGAVLSQLPPV